jgi:hypothetical protein
MGQLARDRHRSVVVKTYGRRSLRGPLGVYDKVTYQLADES